MSIKHKTIIKKKKGRERGIPVSANPSGYLESLWVTQTNIFTSFIDISAIEIIGSCLNGMVRNLEIMCFLLHKMKIWKKMTQKMARRQESQDS